MQAPSSLLSSAQRHSLESTYACFQGVTAFLESVDSKLQPEEKLIAETLRDLAAVCEYRLIEAFPELHMWLAQWQRGGVS